MIIPSSFKLMGKTITVQYDNSLVDRKNSLGNTWCQEIRLQNPGEQISITREDLEQTFFHELVHSILNSMSEKELSGNEKFVELFSSLLHQALTTQSGDIDERMEFGKVIFSEK